MAALHLLGMFCIPLLAAIAVGFVVTRITSLRVRRRHALVGSTTGDGTPVRGRLVVRGEGLGRDARGREIAAWTRWRTSSRGGVSDLEIYAIGFAPSVAISTDDGEVELRGEVRVMSGGDVVYAAEKIPGVGRIVKMSLAAGDMVTAIGRLVETSSAHDTDYRDTAAQRRLEPMKADDSIALIGEMPRVRLERAFLHPWVILAAIPFLWLPWSAITDWSKTSQTITAERCTNEGQCHVVPTWRCHAWRDVLKGWWSGNHYDAGPASAADCAASHECLLRGACSVVDGDCRAARDEDCLASWECMDSGECSAADGHCTIGKDADCAHRSSCVEYGSCSYDGSGSCIAKNDADCAATSGCLRSGACSAVDGTCTIASDADCAKSSVCRTSGDCARDTGALKMCARDDASCKASEMCAFSGQCHADREGSCAALDDDCRRAEVCRALGRCSANAGWCEGSFDFGCNDKSDACQAIGACGGVDHCAPRDDRDCERSIACAKDGACKRIDGSCRKSCADDVDCKLEGRCTQRGDHCVIGGDADCRATFMCAEQGRCAFDGKAHCVARTDDDCRASLRCYQIGACTARNDVCVIGGASDCRLTESCRIDHVCAMKDGHCGAADESTCKENRACKVLGKCTLVHDDETTYSCVVKSDDDCKQSEACTQHGWCFAVSTNGEGDGNRKCFSKTRGKMR